MANTIESFKTAIQAHGLTPPDTITPGKLHRFPGLGKKPGNEAGWCKLFDDLQGGVFGDFSSGFNEQWQAKRDKSYSETEHKAFKAKCERERRQREAAVNTAHRKAAEKARTLWKRAIFADASNLYLHRKQVEAHGTKTGDSGGLKGVLIVPIYDTALKLVNLQFIQADGAKRFLSGGRKKDCFWWIGKKTPTVLIAEGFATGASIHEHTGCQVFIAFDASNLANVARIVRAKNPDADIIICGDNDKSGTGQNAARQAALVCGGKYLIPPQTGQDWNDAVNAGGGL